MTVTHVGTSRKYSANWAAAFGKQKPQPSAGGKVKKSVTAKKKSAKKVAKKAKRRA